MKRRRAVLRAVTLAAAAVALAFLVLPVAAIFLRVPPGKLLHQLTSPVVTDALIVSAKTSLIAQALILLFGTPLAYVVASRRFRGRALVVTLVELPLVLPPAVAGIGLLALFGRAGLLGTSIPFTQTAVVLAVAFVASPLYIRQAIAAFEAVDADVVAAARTLANFRAASNAARVPFAVHAYDVTYAASSMPASFNAFACSGVQSFMMMPFGT